MRLVVVRLVGTPAPVGRVSGVLIKRENWWEKGKGGTWVCVLRVGFVKGVGAPLGTVDLEMGSYWEECDCK